MGFEKLWVLSCGLGEAVGLERLWVWRSCGFGEVVGLEMLWA